MDVKSLAERLEAYPKLQEKLAELLEVMENKGGRADLADDAEDQIVEIGRAMNHRSLQYWADHRAAETAAFAKRKHPRLRRDSKKN